MRKKIKITIVTLILANTVSCGPKATRFVGWVLSGGPLKIIAELTEAERGLCANRLYQALEHKGKLPTNHPQYLANSNTTVWVNKDIVYDSSWDDKKVWLNKCCNTLLGEDIVAHVKVGGTIKDFCKKQSTTSDGELNTDLNDNCIKISNNCMFMANLKKTFIMRHAKIRDRDMQVDKNGNPVLTNEHMDQINNLLISKKDDKVVSFMTKKQAVVRLMKESATGIPKYFSIDRSLSNPSSSQVSSIEKTYVLDSGKQSAIRPAFLAKNEAGATVETKNADPITNDRKLDELVLEENFINGTPKTYTAEELHAFESFLEQPEIKALTNTIEEGVLNATGVASLFPMIIVGTVPASDIPADVTTGAVHDSTAINAPSVPGVAPDVSFTNLSPQEALDSGAITTEEFAQLETLGIDNFQDINIDMSDDANAVFPDATTEPADPDEMVIEKRTATFKMLTK